MWNTAETVLGQWTSSMYTPTKLTNRIYKKWSNFQIMGKRSLNVTKNRKVLWLVTWQFDYKKADFWPSKQFAFLWIKNSFFGLPCLEFVILWSKTGSACHRMGQVKAMEFAVCKPPHRSLSLHSSRDQNWIISKRNLLSSNYKTACPGEMLSLHSASLASPNWPPAAWLIWSKGRCLAQSCSSSPGNKRSLRRNAAWLDLLKIAPSRGRTAQCSRPIQGEVLVVCSMKPVQTAELCLSEPWKWSESEVLLSWNMRNRSDGGALFLWTMTMIRERSSVVLRHISHLESETLLLFNIKS